jgi:hypothetical protein
MITRGHELLESWISQVPGGPVGVCYLAKCSVSQLHYIRKGSVPREKARKDIARASRGLVPADAWEEAPRKKAAS